MGHDRHQLCLSFQSNKNTRLSVRMSENVGCYAQAMGARGEEDKEKPRIYDRSERIWFD